ncbi:hypothetical protein HK102_002943 [Quaeritorhiza haematococci]|nr:hypothetical protein HK102_002943 [Quaeritorhiza haematococci]
MVSFKTALLLASTLALSTNPTPVSAQSTSASPSQQPRQTTCKDGRTPVIRREWTQLSKTEQQTYLNAVNELKKQQPRDVTSVPNRYEEHPAFLPWHRCFLRNFEKDLQAINPNIVLPWWDTARDSQDPQKSPLFDKDAFGDDGDKQTNCVNNGAFAGWTRVLPEPGCLTRRFDGGFKRQEPYYSREHVNGVTGPNQVTNYEQFYQFVEGPIHGRPHVGIGGDMNTMESPNDPLFYLLHADIDRMWAEWVQNNPAQANSYGGAFFAADGTVQIATLTDLMQPMNKTVAECMDNLAGGDLCYVYTPNSEEIRPPQTTSTAAPTNSASTVATGTATATATGTSSASASASTSVAPTSASASASTAAFASATASVSTTASSSASVSAAAFASASATATAVPSSTSALASSLTGTRATSPSPSASDSTAPTSSQASGSPLAPAATVGANSLSPSPATTATSPTEATASSASTPQALSNNIVTGELNSTLTATPSTRTATASSTPSTPALPAPPAPASASTHTPVQNLVGGKPGQGGSNAFQGFDHTQQQAPINAGNPMTNFDAGFGSPAGQAASNPVQGIDATQQAPIKAGKPRKEASSLNLAEGIRRKDPARNVRVAQGVQEAVGQDSPRTQAGAPTGGSDAFQVSTSNLFQPQVSSGKDKNSIGQGFFGSSQVGDVGAQVDYTTQAAAGNYKAVESLNKNAVQVASGGNAGAGQMRVQNFDATAQAPQTSMEPVDPNAQSAPSTTSKGSCSANDSNGACAPNPQPRRRCRPRPSRLHARSPADPPTVAPGTSPAPSSSTTSSSSTPNPNLNTGNVLILGDGIRYQGELNTRAAFFINIPLGGTPKLTVTFTYDLESATDSKTPLPPPSPSNPSNPSTTTTAAPGTNDYFVVYAKNSFGFEMPLWDSRVQATTARGRVDDLELSLVNFAGLERVEVGFWFVSDEFVSRGGVRVEKAAVRV